MNTLKDFHKNVEGMGVVYKAKAFGWALKYAWQRAWGGYDDVDVFSLNDSFIERMLPIMKDFRENNFALFCDENNVLTMKETNKILDDMINLLEHSDPNVWMDNIPVEQIGTKEARETINTVEQEAYANQKRFLELFVKNFDQLWY